MELDHGAVGVCTPEDPPVWASECTDLANSRLGAAVLFATDEWFATAERLLDPNPATFDINAYSPQGKTLDGWESRRRRLPGHDWCVIKLGLPGTLKGFEVDTAFFTGNQVPKISIEAATLPPEASNGTSWGLPGAADRLANGGGVQGTAMAPPAIAAAGLAVAQWEWHTILPVAPLRPGYKDRCVHFFEVPPHLQATRFTHLRVNYFPDGGVARLRAWGDVSRDFTSELQNKKLDLASVTNGGRGVGCSNRHYGVPRNLLQSGRGVNMGDGWETGRHPDRAAVVDLDPASGFNVSTASDWCVIQLGAVCGRVCELRVDTKHFKGNFPESIKIDGCCAPTVSADEILAAAASGSGSGHGHGASANAAANASAIEWFPLLGRSRMRPDSEHVFLSHSDGGSQIDGTLEQAASSRAVTHVRLTIYPDGGVMRLRVIGRAIAPMGQPLPAPVPSKL